MHATNVKPTNLGGVSQGFRGRFLGLGARSPIFCHLKKGTFDKSAHFWVPKNGTSSTQIKEPTPETPRNTPQIGGVDICLITLRIAYLGNAYW